MLETCGLLTSLGYPVPKPDLIHPLKHRQELWVVKRSLSQSACPDCDICPALKETLSLFVAGTPEDYMANVRQYETDPLVLDTASQLKSCADRKLTEEG
ncbi:major allergen I polypeptide chain 1-like [Balaenoptera musculus]|uniref:Major allergen I polypeptide chain 1-like n=1 Tax=Balaenoptera musculus TaxID=9771 RepID=A0A8B8VV73_BALMU|nr:major allergen I polypeptide chain 1-like [Balaenoptera musculus]